MKFRVIHNIPSPYRLHTFSLMHKILSAEGVDFHVHFMSKGHVERPASWRNPRIDFPHTYWADYGYKFHHFNPAMLIHIRKDKPDVLMVGTPFDTFTSILSAFFCPTGMRCAWIEGQTKTPGKIHGFIGWFKRFMLSQYPVVAVPGSDGAKFFDMHQALTSRKMPDPILLPNLVDEKRFKPRSEWSPDVIAQIRHDKFKVNSKTRVCFIPARLAPVKGLMEFFSLVTPDMLEGWKIVVLGDGPLREQILQLIKSRGVSECVAIIESIPYAEMPKYYAASDLFMLPSRHDPNPLSVIEAEHSGLPIALTDRAGNVEEAVTQGANGWRIPVLNTDSYKATLTEIFSTPMERLHDMGRISKEKNSLFWQSESAVRSFLDKLGALN